MYVCAFTATINLLFYNDGQGLSTEELFSSFTPSFSTATTATPTPALDTSVRD